MKQMMINLILWWTKNKIQKVKWFKYNGEFRGKLIKIKRIGSGWNSEIPGDIYYYVDLWERIVYTPDGVVDTWITGQLARLLNKSFGIRPITPEIEREFDRG